MHEPNSATLGRYPQEKCKINHREVTIGDIFQLEIVLEYLYSYFP